jgi:hypothetical protein
MRAEQTPELKVVDSAKAEETFVLTVAGPKSWPVRSSPPLGRNKASRRRT